MKSWNDGQCAAGNTKIKYFPDTDAQWMESSLEDDEVALYLLSWWCLEPDITSSLMAVLQVYMYSCNW